MMNYTACTSAEGCIAYYGHAGSELETVGDWQGKDAANLGLSGPADMADWRKAVRGRGPKGEKLSQKERVNRRCLHDITLSVNKPTAVLRALADDSIREVIAGANATTMELAEERMVARVRGVMVETGSMLSAPFYHDITRGRDPGDHIHNTILNAVSFKGKWFAPEMRPVVESSAFLTAAFHNEVARGLRARGYQTEPTKDNFRIVGVPDSACRKLSARRGDIDKEQALRGAALSEQIKGTTDTSKLKELEGRLAHIRSPKGRAALAVLTREKKRDALDPAKLREEWEGKLTAYELNAIAETHWKAVEAVPASLPERDAHHLAAALDTLLQAESRVTEERLMTLALKRGVGEVSLPGLKAALPELPDVVQGNGMVSTQASLDMEAEVIDFARRGRIVWEKHKTPELPDAAKLAFPAFHAMVKEADEAGEKLRIAGDAKGLPPGHPLKILREFTGVRPPGESEPRAKKPVKVSTPKLLAGWGKAMKRHLSLVRKKAFWRQPQTDGVQHELRTRQAAREGIER
ncbi:MobF family relaxase [Tundrisphaera sp. TA3]|uniref:MobF family relaxase n=1 Tax=Tundrisphaera sp. TA3 TaxID=3435775 RepID=UPI003EBE6112